MGRFLARPRRSRQVALARRTGGPPGRQRRKRSGVGRWHRSKRSGLLSSRRFDGGRVVAAQGGVASLPCLLIIAALSTRAVGTRSSRASVPESNGVLLPSRSKRWSRSARGYGGG